MINFSGSKKGAVAKLLFCGCVAGLYATGEGDTELLVEVFLGHCCGVQQALPGGVDRGLKLRL
jgi:hypothetical protein